MDSAPTLAIVLAVMLYCPIVAVYAARLVLR